MVHVGTRKVQFKVTKGGTHFFLIERVYEDADVLVGTKNPLSPDM